MKPTSKEVIDELCKILNATPKEIKGFMTPKEKAKDILDMFGFIQTYDGLDIMDDELTNKDRKECALIVVNELIKYSPNKPNDEYDPIDYFKRVKQEIRKL